MPQPEARALPGRVHFSIAHELGHFYLPAHRERLLKGIMHNSVIDFGSRTPIEIEADEFAADLLMPMELFRAELNRFRNGFCDLNDLSKLAARLGTSLTSTARRYCESDREPCTIFFSENGVIRWGHSSEDMKRTGMYYYKYETPRQSAARRRSSGDFLKMRHNRRAYPGACQQTFGSVGHGHRICGKRLWPLETRVALSRSLPQTNLRREILSLVEPILRGC